MRVEVSGGLERRRRWSQDDKGTDCRGDVGAGRKGDSGCASQRSSGQSGAYLASTSADIRAGRTTF